MQELGLCISSCMHLKLPEQLWQLQTHLLTGTCGFKATYTRYVHGGT